MKRLFLSVLTLGLLLSACDKSGYDVNIDDFQYEATVIGQGLDCGDIYTVSLNSLNPNAVFENGTFYADNLRADLKIAGLKIYLNCREPNDDELYPCTTLGRGYPHIIITDSHRADD